MLILIGERLESGLSGWLSHFLLEVYPQTFVGVVSVRVRGEILQSIPRKLSGGAVTAVYTAQNEQGYVIKTYGETTFHVVDFDGMAFMARRTSSVPSVTAKPR